MVILGVMGHENTPCHDGSAALFEDGRIVTAVEQERVSRNKHAPGEAAGEAAKECLDRAGLELSDVDHIAYGWYIDDPNGEEPPGEFMAKGTTYTEEVLPPSVLDYETPPPIHLVDHHITHLMASVVESGFRDAACLIADGRAETTAITLAEYDDGEIEVIKRFPIESSLGLFYDAASEYAGLGRHGSGKLMGLSSYGSPSPKRFFDFDPDTGELETPIATENHHEDVRDQWKEYFEEQCFPYRSGENESVAYYQDFAATVQSELTSVIRSIVEYLDGATSSDNLILGGGVFLNCVSNQRLYQLDLFDDLFLYPPANDAGSSVGAIYELCRALDVEVEPFWRAGSFDPYAGPRYPEGVDGALLSEEAVTVESLTDEELIEQVATDLANSRVVGWFQGRLEFGPRALGNRSLLGNPTSRETLYRMNELKGRARWRPLAPSVLEESFTTVFEGACSRQLAKYMTTTATIREEWRSKVPATTHVDGTSRPQIVTEELNERYHALISRFHEKTGVPLVLNTSFNLSGDPIVMTPQQAVETFRKAERMDALVVENQYVTRSD